MSATDSARAAIPAHLLRLMGPADRLRYSRDDLRAADAPAAALSRPPAPDLTGVSVDLYREEIRLQGEILSWLRENGCEPGYARPDRKSTLPLGWPDIFFAAPRTGKACAVEVKTPSGKLSDEQIEKISSMRKAGWVVEVVRSLADVQAFLASVESGST